MSRLSQHIGTVIARFLTVPLDLPPALPTDIVKLRTLLQPADVILAEGNLRISAVIKTLAQSIKPDIPRQFDYRKLIWME